MKRKLHTIGEYQQISADVWGIFKKYFPVDANTDTFAEDIHEFDLKYKENPRTYEFAQKLLKVYFTELNELKGLREDEQKRNKNKR